MNIFKVKTSVWGEEDFILATQLSEKQIRSIIQPMIEEEQESDFEFTNGDYLERLREAYPKSVILTDLDSPDEIIF